MISQYSTQQPALKSKLVSHSENKHTLTIEPLMPGFGYTFGNSIRRIMLSSIPGYAVTRIRINDLTHEYQGIDNVVEDALDIMLNLKQLRPIITTDDERLVLTLNKEGEGDVYASDFESNSSVRIANPELYICSLDKNGKISIEVEVARGTGYLSSDSIKYSTQTNPHDILVDALFSPVTNVSLNVEQVRVGDKTNFDKIEVNFETDQTVNAEEVVKYTFGLMSDLVQQINNVFSSNIVEQALPESTISESDVISSSDIDLPKRIKSILEKNDITTNDQLKNRLAEVESFAGITEKSYKSIEEYVSSLD